METNSTNKLIQISNEDELLKNKIKVNTTRNLPIITDFDNMNIDKNMIGIITG